MSKKRPTEFEQLIKDYHRDNRTIQIMRIAWLPAEEIMKGRSPGKRAKNAKPTNKIPVNEQRR